MKNSICLHSARELLAATLPNIAAATLAATLVRAGEKITLGPWTGWLAGRQAGKHRDHSCHKHRISTQRLLWRDLQTDSMATSSSSQS
jgi:hypothetical protein